MSVKALYVKGGSDPTTITWPAAGPPYERWILTSGTPVVIFDLIGYGDGSITYADGRLLPASTTQGSTVKHKKD
jgi:hypothetical protein